MWEIVIGYGFGFFIGFVITATNIIAMALLSKK